MALLIVHLSCWTVQSDDWTMQRLKSCGVFVFNKDISDSRLGNGSNLPAVIVNTILEMNHSRACEKHSAQI